MIFFHGDRGVEVLPIFRLRSDLELGVRSRPCELCLERLMLRKL